MCKSTNWDPRTHADVFLSTECKQKGCPWSAERHTITRTRHPVPQGHGRRTHIKSYQIIEQHYGRENSRKVPSPVQFMAPKDSGRYRVSYRSVPVSRAGGGGRHERVYHRVMQAASHPRHAFCMTCLLVSCGGWGCRGIVWGRAGCLSHCCSMLLPPQRTLPASEVCSVIPRL